MAASWRAGRSTCSRAMIAEPPSANPIVARTIGPPSSGVMWIPEPVLARTLPLFAFRRPRTYSVSRFNDSRDVHDAGLEEGQPVAVRQPLVARHRLHQSTDQVRDAAPD